MSPQLIIAAIIATASFGSAWQIQSWRMDAKEKANVEQILVDQRSTATAALRRQEVVIAAQAAANSRAAVLRRDADSARTALERLRVELAGLQLRSGEDSTGTRGDGGTLSELLGECAAAYSAVAAKADSHANEVKLLIEAWPR